MTTEEIADIFARPYAQQLLNGPEPARMAYNGLDGAPRVIPIGFWTEGEQVMTDDQYPSWVAGVRSLYDEMVTIRITPTWAKLLDFETTLPKAVDDLIKEKSAG